MALNSYCDEAEWGFGWLQEEPLERCSHVVLVDGRVWVFDPVDAPGVEERIRNLGEPAGVIQLLDRHRRDSAALAARLGVPHHLVPFRGVSGAPFEAIPIVRRRFWREVALWWPQEQVLLCGDALGTGRHYRVGGERLAVHPFLRLLPPKALSRCSPQHILCGHGAGVHGDEAGAALDEALATARRRLPALALNLLRNPPVRLGRTSTRGRS
jgi:hypothetical protein